MDIDKVKALADHLGIKHFTVDTGSEELVYVGEEEDYQEDWENNPDEYEDYADCIAQNATLLEDEFSESNNLYSHGNQEYYVLTDEEADEKWDESMQNYIDEVILPEIPKVWRKYFDEDKWKEDAKSDGRGHSISGYDGNENEEDGYYIYRVN